MYDYLVGAGILGLVFLCLYVARKDLRRVMVFSGLLNIAFLTPVFILLRVLIYNPSRAITPGYWSPPTLFSLGQKTGGYAIEDVLFMFFSAGIAAASYEFVLRKRPTAKSDKRLKKRYALLTGLAGGIIIYTVFPVNAIYLLISFQFLGALVLIYQRKDLLIHSLSGGLLFLIIYGLAFYSFNLIFPAFVNNYFNLNYTSHILFLGVPLEEYLYALSFGLIWAPVYEYMHQVKDQNSKQQSSKLQKTSRAAGGARR